MVGFETADDAAVYVLDPDTALLLTVDFFTPIVDDAYDFGRIAAANSLSDIYAMGGRPLTALNLVAFPCSLGPGIVAEVLRGGGDVVRSAGAVVIGGHTIDDKEPKFGLSVMGVVHPSKVVRNTGAVPGDSLVLTKALGTGVIGTALKRGLETEESAREVIESMATLNRDACEAMVETGVHAATDVTGFGLLGHLHEMMSGSGCAASIDLDAVPVFAGVREHVERGVVPGRTADIIEYASAFARWTSASDRTSWMNILCDPQTSGGLLIAVEEGKTARLSAELEARGVGWALVGRVTDGEPGTVEVA